MRSALIFTWPFKVLFCSCRVVCFVSFHWALTLTALAAGPHDVECARHGGRGRREEGMNNLELGNLSLR